MKWVRFESNGTEAYGQLDSDNNIQVTDATWAGILAGEEATVTGETSLEQVNLRNPVENPSKIVAIGLNYLDHCRETNTTPPSTPLIFTKFTTSIIGPGDEICWSPELSSQVDYEVELAAVIGKDCSHVSEADALDYVAGYTVANDVSARDLQFSDGQWVRAKSLDTFCPMGPAFVTADEIPDPQVLEIRCTLNGQVMQNSNTKEMIFSVANLVSYCSASFKLNAGDVIITGTPHGVGLGMDPQVFMKEGDVVVVEVEKIGQLENVCREV